MSSSVCVLKLVPDCASVVREWGFGRILATVPCLKGLANGHLVSWQWPQDHCQWPVDPPSQYRRDTLHLTLEARSSTRRRLFPDATTCWGEELRVVWALGRPPREPNFLPLLRYCLWMVVEGSWRVVSSACNIKQCGLGLSPNGGNRIFCDFLSLGKKKPGVATCVVFIKDFP